MSQSSQNDRSWSKWHMRLHKRLKQNTSLLPSNSTLLLAVSGGQDSMALLKLIIDLKRLHKWQVEIWHGNHQWHAKSEKTEEELKLWCLKNQISFHSDKADKKEVANEEKARDWRYKNLILKAKFLSSKNIHFPCTRILTGHTATDRAETVIMNLARGTDLTGLTTLKEQRTIENKIEFKESFTLVVGNMIGAGIFMLPISLSAFGSISILGWIISGIISICLASVFKKLSREYPGESGPFTYTKKYFGEFTAFLVVWGYWISILLLLSLIHI